MTTIVTRSGKGSALTYEEMDSNLTNLKTDVESTQANVIAANARIATLDANLGTATTNITTLFANAGTQSTEITNLWSNAAAQSTAIAGKTTTTYVDSAISTAVNNLINSAPGTLDTLGEIAANLATNADTVGAILNSITSTNGNVTAANARIATIDANLGTATTNISTLFTNAATQATSINAINANLGAYQTFANANVSSLQNQITGANARIATIDANLGTATTNITTLFTNAATQATSIRTLDANLGTATTNISALQANTGSFYNWANVNLNYYTNANVAAYLPAYGGNVLINTATANAVAISTTANLTPAIGKLVWDSGTGTLAYSLAGGNVVNYVGQQENALVYNAEATTLNKGEVVYIFGAQGQRPSVKRALASSDTTSARTIGIVAESIAAGAEGFITVSGQVANIDTSAFTEGSILYLSGTVAGAITATKPQAPTHLVYVGVCLKSNASSGRIQVTIQNGYELDEIHDVQIESKANNDVLMYDATTGVWRNKTIANLKSNLSLATVATTGAYSDLTGLPTLYSNTNTAAYLSGTVTVGNLTTTQGIFWSNGTPYSTGGGGSTYGNTEVAAYLPTYTGSLAGSSSIVDLYANAATQATEISSLWSNAASQATSIAAKANTASLAAVALSGSYADLSNRPTIPGQDSATANQVVYKNGSNVATGSSSLTFDGTNLSSPYLIANNSSGDEGGEILLAKPQTNSTFSGTGVTIDVYQNRLRFFEQGGSARGAYIDLTAAGAGVASNLLAGGSSTYGNSDVATYLPTHTGNISAGNITVTTKTQTGSLYTTNGIFWTGNGAAYSTGGSTYGNTEVAAYLPTYSGALKATSLTSDSIDPLDITAGLGSDLNLKSGSGGGSIYVTAQEGEIVLDTTPGLATYGITARSDVLITLDAPTITANGVLQNVNGGRIVANAYPLSTGDTTIPGNGTSRFMVYRPTYTAGVLQQPPLANATVGGTGIVATSSQVIGLIQSANIAYQSGYGFGSQNRDTVNFLSQTTVTPVTANSMNNNDRVRGGAFSLDLINTAGKGWGAMSTTSQNATTLAGLNAFVNLNGYGNIGNMVGGVYGAFVTPTANQTANVQYINGVMSFLTLQSTAGTSGKANVVYSRGFTPFIAGFSSNLTVQYAVGMHTYSGWAGSGTVGTSNNPVLGRFALLNEDTNTTIQTNGPVVIGGSSASLTVSGNVTMSSAVSGGFFKFVPYAAATLNTYTGTVGQVAAVSDQGGKLAYWDTTNSRWSYVHDNSAV